MRQELQVGNKVFDVEDHIVPEINAITKPWPVVRVVTEDGDQQKTIESLKVELVQAREQNKQQLSVIEALQNEIVLVRSGEGSGEAGAEETDVVDAATTVADIEDATLNTDGEQADPSEADGGSETGTITSEPPTVEDAGGHDITENS